MPVFLIRGKSSKSIARKMSISYRTVEFHIDNIKTKFGCRSKSELISVAIQLGYLSIIPPGLSLANLTDGLENA